MARIVPDLSALAVPGTRIAMRVTPKASRNALVPADTSDGPLRVYVTTAPESGKANAAVLKLLAKALGLPKSRLSIVQGETGRDKLVEIG
ncbi:DUF167 domain-containing protein [Nioella aestuarii]|uniref:DUF167 domain-containing protein n=1 Tax=Nioella aestuarii TaxID=1662864 RepID=UPI003D7F604F